MQDAVVSKRANKQEDGLGKCSMYICSSTGNYGAPWKGRHASMASNRLCRQHTPQTAKREG